MSYVIGVDLGTSSVKIILVNEEGYVIQKVSKPFTLIQEQSGYSEQDPQDWVDQTILGLSDLMQKFDGYREDIKGISFSGQMHGLVLLNKNNEVLRNAILWNDTRTTEECNDIHKVVGKSRLLKITKNLAVEGLTLPKLLWVKKNEPMVFSQTDKFVLPKDYVRYRLTSELYTDYSDAAGTLLLDIPNKKWSDELCALLNIDYNICPKLIESHKQVGNLQTSFAEQTGLAPYTPVFAGGADNACGAIGSGILEDGKTLCSIGTSGVVLSYETSSDMDFEGKIHYFYHGAPNSFYTMGVTLAAGYSLSWFKDVFALDESYEDLLSDINIDPGSNGLLFTPYLLGERTPYADSVIRGSFIGIDSSHTRKHFVHAVLEGITFSLNESIEILREKGKTIDTIVSIGGGAQNEIWLQMQADIFNTKVIKLSNEEGPGMGAAMLAAYGLGWFNSLKVCANTFLNVEKEYIPNVTNVEKYKRIFGIYKNIYSQTQKLSQQIKNIR